MTVMAHKQKKKESVQIGDKVAKIITLKRKTVFMSHKIKLLYLLASRHKIRKKKLKMKFFDYIGSRAMRIIWYTNN